MLHRDHPTCVQWLPIVQRRFGRLTAFRLGFVAGEVGQAPECPYDDPRGRGLFVYGIRCGREHVQRRLEREAAEAPP